MGSRDVNTLCRQPELLRLKCSRGTGVPGLTKKIGKYSPVSKRLRIARVAAAAAAAARQRSKAQDIIMTTESMNHIDTTAASAVPSHPFVPANTSMPMKTSGTNRDDGDGVVSNMDDVDDGQASMTTFPSDKPLRQVVLLPSVFEGRPPVLFFSYTAACGATQRPLDRAVYCDIGGPRIFYSLTAAVNGYNAVINTMRQGGMYRVKADNPRWLVSWTNQPVPDVMKTMKASQRTNHFPGSWHLGGKDLMWRSISKMLRRYGECFMITPQGFVLPTAFGIWDSLRLQQPDALWIWKPCRQSCGRGIHVFSSTITDAEAQEIGKKEGVIQRYIPNPLLIDGFKFDLRIYVVVLSYDPLKVYINEEGLVRLATEKYSSDASTLDTRTMHLTNYSVNKLSPAFVQNTDGTELQEEGKGASKAAGCCHASKWSLRELRMNFENRGLDYDAMFNGINDVVIKTLLAVNKPFKNEWCKALDQTGAGWLARGVAGAHCSSTSSCFEIYGFDILIDDDLKPWLLEVNTSPSLSSGSPLDKRIKTKLVADTLTLVGIRPPPSVWRRTCGSMRIPSSESVAMVSDETQIGVGCTRSSEELASRAATIAACESPMDALAHFDELAWETVIEAHDADMRCGGLQRIYPTAESFQYVRFMEEESFFNLVLRKWYEAGGGKIFGSGCHKTRAAPVVPSWVPRKVCFQQT
eukprot:TRINITY_DN8097_c0_g1_i1.p1 TRINITY_DN8097_c0_g1~~TRINITY_DN8097_c0_g1_i1.p1  ORF type:complete len:694 (+),score=85.37 TRINITY_DN8097_c0_g1_i1:162-2243(+)